MAAALDHGDLWAVWTVLRDGVCTPGWWRWGRGLLYSPVGGQTYRDATPLLDLGDNGIREGYEDGNWVFMVEQLVAQGDLPHDDWKD